MISTKEEQKLPSPDIDTMAEVSSKEDDVNMESSKVVEIDTNSLEEMRKSTISDIEQLQKGLRERQDSFCDSTKKKSALITNLDLTIDLISDILSKKDSLVAHFANEKANTVFAKVIRILTELKQQLKFVMAVLELEEETEMEIQAVERLRLDHLLEASVLTDLKSRDIICTVTLEYTLSFLMHHLLAELLNICLRFFQKDRVPNREKVMDMQIIVGKIATVVDYLPDAVCYNKEDIFSLNKTGPYWEELFKLVEFKEVAPLAQINKSFGGFCKNILVANATLSQSSEIDNQTKRTLTMAYGAVYFFFMEAQATKQANLFYAEADSQSAFKVWNILEKKWIKEMLKVILPPIKYNKKLRMSRAYPALTLDKVKKQLAEGTMQSITPGWLDETDEETMKKLHLSAVGNRSKDELGKKGENKISMRVLSHKPLPELLSCPLGSKPQPRRSNFFEKLIGKAYDPHDPNYDGLILHIHGGGFVAMSSASHQSYTRQWANLVRKPIFSLDYRLAPEFPYPAALDDCWQAYNWILDNCEDMLGVKTSKVIVTGDSAGGNLALALTMLAIKSGKRVPDGLCLSYPALNLNAMKFSPSYLLAIDDQLLTYSFLKLCVAAYLPEGADPQNDPLLSPIRASEELFAQLPPTRILVGSKDPLHDESWRFIDKANKHQKNVKLVVYKGFPHGFLNFDVPQGMKEAKETVIDGAAALLELFEL